MLLVGDIGGTKALLGLTEPSTPRPHRVEVASFRTLEYESLPAIIEEFLERTAGSRGGLDAAAFGVAGPVTDHRLARLTNVPWTVDAAEIGRRFGVPAVTVLNDVEAMARSLPVLAPSELALLQQGAADARGNLALIAAGTGLGEAVLHDVGGRLVPFATEAGHADFAARTPAELELVRALAPRFGRVQNERVLSGPGLSQIHRTLHPDGCAAVTVSADDADHPALVSAAALEGRCARCVATLDLFVRAYGSEAGNLALRALATGGVYLGGGIAPRILPVLKAGGFIEAFLDKPPMTDLLARIPVQVIVNNQAGLLGAAVAAAELAKSRG